ncbi:MAG: hypothetical protein ACOYOE_02255 [Chlorobium sp.]
MPVSPPSTPRHYVVVVHGIGEQKLNETIPPFVHRFAEVRQNKQDKYDIILPATQSSQSVRSETEQHGWAEYRGIPIADKGEKLDEIFDGTHATETAGENFRFVELYWQDILQRHQELFASETEVWARAMLNRLNDENITPPEWLPSWAVPMLESIVNTAVPLKQMLALKYTPLVKTVFDGYLGDVHLYGDYTRTRGEAVRHFHLELDKLIFNDFLDWRRRELDAGKLNGGVFRPAPYQRPDITIVAHSLGGIMSFDALVYAFVKEEIRMASSESIRFFSSLPFPGYTTPLPDEENIHDIKQQKINAFVHDVEAWLNEEHAETVQCSIEHYWEHFLDGFREQNLVSQPQTEKPPLFNGLTPERIPPLLWRTQVKNFITLGAPIDKFVVMWHKNYLHLDLMIERYDKLRPGESQYDFPEPSNTIKHYNFCDEQDPVGHHLDLTRNKTRVYRQLFDITDTEGRDVVYRRYAVPGVAHLGYWKDQELFKKILWEIIDRKPGQEKDAEKFRNVKKAHTQAMIWAYFRLPFIAALITGIIIALGIHAHITGEPLKMMLSFFMALFLWIIPAFLTYYKEKTSYDGVHQSRFRLFLMNIANPGIFTRLIVAAVEWRRILLNQSEGESNNTGKNSHVAFQNKGEKWIWKPFAWRWLWRMAVTLLLLCITIDKLDCTHSFPDEVWLVITSGLLCYVISMMIVLVQYISSIRKYAGKN